MWNYYRGEVNDYFINNYDGNNYRKNNDKRNKKTASKYLKHNKNLIGSTPNNNCRLNEEVVVSLKLLSICWRSLGFPLINREIKLDLIWTKRYVISDILTYTG